MNPVLENIVLLHELGHDQLHKDSAIAKGGFQEFNIFDMSDNRIEYEANIFASQISLPDEEILDYIESGYDIQQIASIMGRKPLPIILQNLAILSLTYRVKTRKRVFLPISYIMNSDINLVALKNDTLISQGYRFWHLEHKNTFLRYDR